MNNKVDTSKINFFWFRRDLRLQDNTGLTSALKASLPVQCVFIFDTAILEKLEDKHDARVAFIHEQIQLLDEALKKMGSGLITIYDTPQNAWTQLVTQYNIHGVYTNTDYEPYATQRDNIINSILQKNKIEFHSFKDHVLFEKKEIVKDDGSPYTVFTPYKNRCMKSFSEANYASVNKRNLPGNFYRNTNGKIHSLEDIGFSKPAIIFPSKSVSSEVLHHYADKRNFPGVKGTSRLSIHLRFGTVSIRSLAKMAVQEKSETWLNELIWRDFYQMILWNFPYVAESAFKPQYNKIHWRNNEQEFQLWCEGKTGYPIVDAGMRELNGTGFMHNRVRMITASFLVKHLLIDWRWGEAYFAKKLNDFDLASNNGGWQWAAGSGCDAAPYFRIFNPYEQTRKFDSDFKYIRKWVPEFEDFSYPPPIVEHIFARERCLKVYAESLSAK